MQNDPTFKAAVVALMTAVQLRGDFPEIASLEVLDECAELSSTRSECERDDVVRVMKALLRDEDARIAIGRLAYLRA